MEFVLVVTYGQADGATMLSSVSVMSHKHSVFPVSLACKWYMSLRYASEKKPQHTHAHIYTCYNTQTHFWTYIHTNSPAIPDAKGYHVHLYETVMLMIKHLYLMLREWERVARNYVPIDILNSANNWKSSLGTKPFSVVCHVAICFVIAARDYS